MSATGGQMQNVLVVIPAGSEPQRAIGAAIELARQRGGNLIALIVLDPRSATRAARTLSESGFMSEEVGTQVTATIEHEYRSDAATLLRAVAERAKRDGIVVTPLIEEGDASEICRRVIRAHDVGAAVLVAEKRSWLTRFLSHGAVQLPALAGCEIKVMEED